MKRESAFHLVRALRLSFASPETADELEEFIIDLLETVEFSAVGKSVVRGELLVNEQIEPPTVQPIVEWTSEDVLSSSPTTRAVPITDE